MKVRITTAGWEGFTGSLGFQAVFQDGVSVVDLNARQVARIGASLCIVDVETGEQVGPATVARLMQAQPLEVAPPSKTLAQVQEEEDEARRARLIDDEAKRKVELEKSLAEAEERRRQAAEAAKNTPVIYSRAELEAIGSNDGIAGLRQIATPLHVKATSISAMVDKILDAQSKLAVA